MHDGFGGNGMIPTNVFYSERMQKDIALANQRPVDLPVPDDDELEDEPPSIPDGDCGRAVGPTGKGRGTASKPATQSSGCFVTPPSRRSEAASALGHLGADQYLGAGRRDGDGVRSQGVMPAADGLDAKMGLRTQGPQPNVQSDVELQRALEREIVDHLREENARLMAELDKVKSMQGHVPSTTTSSWT